MIGATFAVALLFMLLAVSRRNAGTALGLMIFSMFVWPEFLRVPLGIVQMSVPRFVAIVLLLMFIARGRNRKIHFGKIDVIIILLWLWTILATFVADAAFTQVSQMIGRGLDTMLMYFVARMAIQSDEDVKGLYVPLALTALAMCVAGAYEALTWHSPYHQFSGGAARITGYSEIRHGMLRAQSSTQNSIYFGMAMMVVLGLIWSLRGYVRRPFRHKIIALAASVAVLSSLSSGPWLALAAFIGISFYYMRPAWIKPSLYALAVLVVIVELVSNRHFYNLIDYLALDSKTAWYRTRLMEVAVSKWRDYWLFGVGSNWPHHWAAIVDGRQYIDVVNNFLIVALYGGIPAVAMYVESHIIGLRYAVHAWHDNPTMAHRKLLFGLAAALLALDFSSFSVGLFGPVLLLSNVLLGILVSVSICWQQQSSQREPFNSFPHMQRDIDRVRLGLIND
jgi:hypothetical protein